MSEPSIGEPVDLEALVVHAARLSDEVQAVWSETIGEARHSAALQQLEAKWSSVMTAVVEGSRALAERLEAAGIDPRLPELPPFPAEVAGLRFDPPSEEAVRQAQMGQLVAVEQLARAIGVVLGSRAPDASDDREPDAISEGSAFSAARERAMLVARLSRAVSRAEAKLLDTARIMPSASPPVLGRLDLAAAAWSHGDPEAALVHLHLATPMLVADLLGASATELPNDVGERLARHDGLERLSSMVIAARRVAGTIAAGAEPDLGLVTVLVPNLLHALTDLTLRPPSGVLRVAFEDVLPEGPP